MRKHPYQDTRWMSLVSFIDSLLAGGPVKVSRPVDQAGRVSCPSSAEADEAAAALMSFEAEYRDSLAVVPPRLSLPALMWGAMTTFRACGFVVHRDLDEAVMQTVFEDRCPETPSPAVCYSVDLTLRFLPDLVRLAKARSTTDPLVEHLKAIGRQWPLSSVGILDLGECDPSPFLSDRSLRTLYIDRIIAAKDSSRVQHPVVRDAVKSAAGLHHELGFPLDPKL